MTVFFVLCKLSTCLGFNEKNTPVETTNRIPGMNNMQPHDMHNTRGIEEMKNFLSYSSKL